MSSRHPTKEGKARVEELIATFGGPKRALYRLDEVMLVTVRENERLHERVKELTAQVKELGGTP